MVFDTHRACLRTRFLSTHSSTVYVGATSYGDLPKMSITPVIGKTAVVTNMADSNRPVIRSSVRVGSDILSPTPPIVAVRGLPTFREGVLQLRLHAGAK
jgi:hypothetical protein